MKQIQSEASFFWSLPEILDKFSFYIRNVLENKDWGKRHKIWAKRYCPLNFFGWYAYDNTVLSLACVLEFQFKT